ncbi:hypothetical protein JXQ70_17395 [bacterium]|nr:hypothetical protein [bacterium]
MTKVKENLIKIIEKMPDNAAFEDIMARLYFVHKVNKGLQYLDDSKGFRSGIIH